MKFRITFKDPDGVSEVIYGLAAEYAASLTKVREEQKAIKEVKLESLKEFIDPWIEYQEYITVEFDTEANTATVINVR